MKSATLLIACGLAWGQNLPDVVKQGEQVFAKSCATGYCHGARGTSSGAPRLAARGFDQGYINNVVTRGVPGGAMPSFAKTLSPADMTAVVAYVATLNGIANPNITSEGLPPAPAAPAFSGEAARGRELFSDAVRGFARCSTCHEVNGIGIAVAAPIVRVPADVGALRALATPGVATATLSGERMPALVLSKGSKAVIFYDLTTPPPVMHTAEPASVTIADGTGWSHSVVIGGYSDGELGAILAYLRAVIKP